MSRTIVKDVNGDGSAGAGTGKKDPPPGSGVSILQGNLRALVAACEPSCKLVRRPLARPSLSLARFASCSEAALRLDDQEEWSDGEPSDDETEQEKKERTVWERSQKEGEQYLPKRFLKGGAHDFAVLIG